MVSNITSISASSGGEITSDGGSAVTTRGVCLSISQNPTITENKTNDGTGSGNFISLITGLMPGATYYIKAYAINAVGTAYSSQATFTTLALAPVLTTTELSVITSSSISTGGKITNDGGSPVTARGICWGTSQMPTIANDKTTDGTGSGSFTSAITGLLPGATYYFRAYATNSIGTAYGNQLNKTTQAVLSTISTSTATAITSQTATSGGNITNNGGAEVTARGVCWSTAENPTTFNSKTLDATNSAVFTSSIIGLTPGVTYFVRAYATNSAGTAYGSVISFKTNAAIVYGSVTDIEGNVYKTVAIGTQIWMAENLKTTKYRNGDVIPYITANTTWLALTTGAYSWYNNDINNKTTNGALYNWYAVNNIKKLAPLGWHIPSDTEWTTLITYLGGDRVADDKMKEAGVAHWPSPNTSSTNESGFTALPSGGRKVIDGTFYALGDTGFWWSTSSLEGQRAVAPFLNNSSYLLSHSEKQYGFSVRCLKQYFGKF